MALVEKGYAVQAHGHVAGMLDAAALYARDCGVSSSAHEFFSHSNTKNGGMRTSEGLKALAGMVGPHLTRSDSEIEEYLTISYERASVAKHKNPTTLRGVSVAGGVDSTIYVRTGPAYGSAQSRIVVKALQCAYTVGLIIGVAYGVLSLPEHGVTAELKAEANRMLDLHFSQDSSSSPTLSNPNEGLG